MSGRSSPVAATRSRTTAPTWSRSMATLPSSAARALSFPVRTALTALWVTRSVAVHADVTASDWMTSLASLAIKSSIVFVSGEARKLSSSGSASLTNTSTPAASTTPSATRIERALATASFWGRDARVATNRSSSWSVVLTHTASTAVTTARMARKASTPARILRQTEPLVLRVSSWSRSASFSVRRAASSSSEVEDRVFSFPKKLPPPNDD